MEKLERDGLVGVVYSPGYGAGWATWNYHGKGEQLCMDARIVQAVLDGNIKAAEQIAQEIDPEFSCLGSDQLQVRWLPKGTVFEITEYDGSESVRVFDSADYFTA